MRTPSRIEHRHVDAGAVVGGNRRTVGIQRSPIRQRRTGEDGSGPRIVRGHQRCIVRGQCRLDLAQSRARHYRRIGFRISRPAYVSCRRPPRRRQTASSPIRFGRRRCRLVETGRTVHSRFPWRSGRHARRRPTTPGRPNRFSVSMAAAAAFSPPHGTQCLRVCTCKGELVDVDGDESPADDANTGCADDLVRAGESIRRRGAHRGEQTGGLRLASTGESGRAERGCVPGPHAVSFERSDDPSSFLPAQLPVAVYQICGERERRAG